MKETRSKRYLVWSGWALAGGATLALLGTYFLRNVWFYRDPVRTPARHDRVIIAPADGRVIYIKRIKNGVISSEKLGTEIALTEITKFPVDVKSGWLIGIYMSPLDVHFNYAPLPGEVQKVVFKPAKANLPMVDMWEYVNLTYLRRAVNLFSKEFHFTNERNTILLKGSTLDVIIVEIADKFVNKIKCFVSEGDVLQLGQKISFIERGSQVDLIVLDDRVQWQVEPGDQVYGGQSVLAEY